MIVEYACKKCHRIIRGKKCPHCGSGEVTQNWKGLVVILDPENSKVAEAMKIETSGEFAIRVK